MQIEYVIGAFFILSFIFFLGYFKDEVDVKRLIILLVITFVILLFLVFARKNQGKYYSSFWVESIPIFWWLAQRLLTYF